MLTYTLNSSDIIMSVGGDWNQFARDNDADDMVAEHVVGRSLFDFVTGGEVVQMYHSLFRKARTQQRPLSFTFRCDAPDCRRRMSFNIDPLPDNGLRITTEAIEEQERHAQRLLNRNERRSNEYVVVCAICSDVSTAEKQWVSMEEESTRQGWLESEFVPQLSHSYCPDCLEEQLRLADVEG